jgi:hypothetical protein
MEVIYCTWLFHHWSAPTGERKQSANFCLTSRVEVVGLIGTLPVRLLWSSITASAARCKTASSQFLFSSVMKLCKTQTLLINSSAFSAPLACAKVKYMYIYIHLKGRAIAQVVNRQLPTTAAQVWTQVRSCGICGGQSGTREGFLRVPRISLPILIPLTAPNSSSSSVIWGWYSRPVSGQHTKWIQSHPTPRTTYPLSHTPSRHTA